jgi:hypothetical protein
MSYITLNTNMIPSSVEAIWKCMYRLIKSSVTVLNEVVGEIVWSKNVNKVCID